MSHNKTNSQGQPASTGSAKQPALVTHTDVIAGALGSGSENVLEHVCFRYYTTTVDPASMATACGNPALDVVEELPNNVKSRPIAGTGTFLNRTEDDAKVFAAEAHANQKYGDRPYVYHLEKVVELAERHAPPELNGEHAKMVAWLHDVLEDTDVSYDALVASFGPRIARAVKDLTGSKGETTNQEMERLSGASPLAKFVKCCDLTANMTACVADVHENFLAGYAANLDRYVDSLGEHFPEQLQKSCRHAELVSKMGMKKTLEHSWSTGGGESYQRFETGYYSWKLPTSVSDGLVSLGESDNGAVPQKPFKDHHY